MVPWEGKGEEGPLGMECPGHSQQAPCLDSPLKECEEDVTGVGTGWLCRQEGDGKRDHWELEPPWTLPDSPLSWLQEVVRGTVTRLGGAGSGPDAPSSGHPRQQTALPQTHNLPCLPKINPFSVYHPLGAESQPKENVGDDATCFFSVDSAPGPVLKVDL